MYCIAKACQIWCMAIENSVSNSKIRSLTHSKIRSLMYVMISDLLNTKQTKTKCSVDNNDQCFPSKCYKYFLIS